MNVVKVRTRKPRRVLSFLCSELSLKRDDSCIVLSDRGEEFGTCILPPEPWPDDMEKRISMKVLRQITDKDQKDRTYIESEELRAREICLKKIKGRKLPMKLVDVEVTFDKKKIIFYFTADDRVDFRELVRDLAHDLRARIEMRHIQVRDEAKMVGGLGGCGRELCCSSWMNEFRPISMRMAKAQNLSLNPSKISGQCGRLLCCLSYENEQYEAMRKKARQDAKDRLTKEAPRQILDATKEVAPAPAEAREKPAQKREGTKDRQTPPPSRGSSRRGPRSDGPTPADTPASPTVAKASTPDAPPTEGSAEGGDKTEARKRPRRNRKRKRGPRPPRSEGGKD
mgnify:CR=1 FL=1